MNYSLSGETVEALKAHFDATNLKVAALENDLTAIARVCGLAGVGGPGQTVLCMVKDLHGQLGWQIERADGAEAEVANLKKLLDRDHTGLAAGLARVRAVIRGWWWIPGGEWGSYEEHERTEEALRGEVGRCFEEVDRLAELALDESGVRAGAAFVPERDKLAAAEAEVACLRAWVKRLQARADGMVELIAAQSVLLSKQAEKGG